ncbi:MAG TPA: heme-binding protein [Ktedonobacteraceae bacterium]
MNLTIDIARSVLEASKQRAIELRSPVSIAIVDAGGHLVLFERMMSPYGWATGNISIAKAHTAVMFNQSTDAVAQWGSGIPGFASSMATMSEGKFIMAAGGWPIRVSSATIGGIGVSGGNAPGRDDDIARAGLAAAEAMYQSQPVGQVQQRPALQPTPSYPSIPSPAGAQFNAPNNPSPAPQNVPNSTHHLDQDGSYGYEEEPLPFDQYNESRGGQP